MKIGLFDIWIENDDRKPTNPNLLIQDSYNGFDIYAIDHAFTFSSIAFKDLNPEFAPAVSANDSILETEFAKKVYKILIKENENWLVEIQDYFYFVIDKCRVNFEDIISSVPTDLGFKQNCKDSLYNFLFSESRNKKVLSEFRRRFVK